MQHNKNPISIFLSLSAKQSKRKNSLKHVRVKGETDLEPDASWGRNDYHKSC